jgi:signal transduction histidine kinase
MTGPSQPVHESSRCAFAAGIEADRAEIISTYIRRLDERGSLVVRGPESREQVIAHADEILSGVIASVRADGVRLADEHLLAWDLGETRAASGIHPRELLRAAEVLFDVTVTTLSRRARTDDESLRLFVQATLAMNRSVTARIHEAMVAYAGFLLGKIHETHLEERRRVARELHDRIGAGISVTHQQLGLYDMYRDTEPVKASAHAETAQQAINAAIHDLRAVISGLCLEASAKSLENALLSCIDDMRIEDVDIRLRLNGDEAWASDAVREESFLVLREAVRNAMSHGDPTKVTVQVDIAPHDLRATVRDNGRGFDLRGECAGSGLGLSSMRERAELMGGELTVSSELAQGTRIDLYVPLPGIRNGRPI